MEDSVRRKERLQTMRMVADQAVTLSDVDPCSSSVLANPLLDVPTALPQEELCVTPRFDFYTDPMAAFSACKKSNFLCSSVKHDYSASLPSISSPMTHSLSPYPGFITPAIASSPGKQLLTSLPGNQKMFHKGTTEPRVGSGGSVNFYGASCGGSRSPYRNPGSATSGSPGSNRGRGRVHWASSSSPPDGPWLGAGSPLPSPLPRHRQWNSSSGSGPGSGQGIGRGRHSFQSCGSAPSAEPMDPQRLYHSSMVEDPWQNLEPIVWQQLDHVSNPAASSPSWLPKSISNKKLRTPESHQKPDLQSSLADCLTSSLQDALNDAPSA